MMRLKKKYNLAYINLQGCGPGTVPKIVDKCTKDKCYDEAYVKENKCDWLCDVDPDTGRTPPKCPLKEELAKSKDVFIYLNKDNIAEQIQFTVLVKDDANPIMTILQGNNAPKKGEQSFDKKSTALRDAGWKDLKEGAYQFCDRDYTFSNVPKEFIGCKYWEGSCEPNAYSYWIKTGRCCNLAGARCEESYCRDLEQGLVKGAEEVKKCDIPGKKNTKAYSAGNLTSPDTLKEGICDDPKMVRYAGDGASTNLRLKVTTTGTVHVLISKGAKWKEGRLGGETSQIYTFSTMQGKFGEDATCGCPVWKPNDLDPTGKFCKKNPSETRKRVDGTEWCKTETQPPEGYLTSISASNRESATYSTIPNFSTSSYPNDPGFDMLTQPAGCVGGVENEKYVFNGPKTWSWCEGGKKCPDSTGGTAK